MKSDNYWRVCPVIRESVEIVGSSRGDACFISDEIKSSRNVGTGETFLRQDDKLLRELTSKNSERN